MINPQFKKGVKIEGVRAEIAFIHPIVIHIVMKYDKVEGYVCTSVVEGKHKSGSRHYMGWGFDVRTRNMTLRDKKACFNDLKDALTDEFDVVWHETHIHIEFDPKRG